MDFTLTFDSRDNVFDTHQGNILANSVQAAGGPLGGDRDFVKNFTRASHYLGLFRGSVMEFRGRVGLSWPYGDSEAIPIYERYFAGGSSTVRGYDERKLGPIDPDSKDPLGGNSMFVGNLEYTYPVFSFLKLAAFYDTGNVWEKVKTIGKGGLKSGVGCGVRIRTPIGPIMLDYGIPLDKAPGEDSKKKGGRLHFSMSQGF
jgi:outer membrane protein insertion porin family